MLPERRAPGCTACGGPVASRAWTQLPLLMHAGYGEATKTEVEACVTAACAKVRTVAVAAASPRGSER